VSGEQLSEELEKLAGEHGVSACELTLAVTGGEPLEQTDFLEEWLPRWPGRVLLETAGLWPERLERLLPHVDVVSLDWKLAGTLERGRERVDPCECARRFGESGIEGWVKVVVCATTSDQELDRALARLSAAAPGVRTFLQPVTPAGRGPAAPPPARLLEWVIRNRKRGLDLRVLPQVHPLLGLH